MRATIRALQRRRYVSAGGGNLRFELGDALLQRFQLFAGLAQHLALHVEFRARNEIEAREPGREHRFHVLLDVLRRRIFDGLADARGKLVEAVAY